MKNSAVTRNNKHLNSAKLYQYSLALKQPISFKQIQVCQRKGLIVALQFSDGSYGVGDIAPLPGFSHESLAECIAASKAFLISLVAQKTLKPIVNDLPPAVAFGIDCALNFELFKHKKPQIITQESDSNQQTTPFLQGNKSAIIQQFKALDNNSRVKLKVARGSLDDDINIIKSLLTLNPNLTCILDANQGWNLKQAVDFSSQIQQNFIEYIEEPCLTLKDSLRFSSLSGIGIGLDETLQSPNFIFTPDNRIKALIIKPTLIGNLKRCLEYISIAKQEQIKCYLSSSFESSIGLFHIEHIAKTYCQGQPTGLDTGKFFKENIIISPESLAPIKQLDRQTDNEPLEVIWQS